MKKYIHLTVCLCTCLILLFNASPAHAISHDSTIPLMPVVVSLGDSYSSGEGIQPYFDQYKENIYKYTSEDWIAHRSTLAWPGLLTFNGVQANTVRATNLNVSNANLHPAQGIANGSWYFAAVSGAVCANIYSKNNNDRQKITVNQPFNDFLFDGRL